LIPRVEQTSFCQNEAKTANLFNGRTASHQSPLAPVIGVGLIGGGGCEALGWLPVEGNCLLLAGSRPRPFRCSACRGQSGQQGQFPQEAGLC
jgi:hypothetical protein